MCSAYLFASRFAFLFRLVCSRVISISAADATSLLLESAAAAAPLLSSSRCASHPLATSSAWVAGMRVQVARETRSAPLVSTLFTTLDETRVTGESADGVRCACRLRKSGTRVLGWCSQRVCMSRVSCHVAVGTLDRECVCQRWLHVFLGELEVREESRREEEKARREPAPTGLW